MPISNDLLNHKDRKLIIQKVQRFEVFETRLGIVIRFVLELHLFKKEYSQSIEEVTPN